MSPLPPELRDGPLSAPDIPEGPHGEDGVVADSRSGYVLRWGRRPKPLCLVPGKEEAQGPNSIENVWLEKPVEFWLEIPHTQKKKLKNA